MMRLIDMIIQRINNWKREQPRVLYRNSLVRMFYTNTPTEKTPTPFLEMRAFVISKKPLPWSIIKSRLMKELDNLEFILSGVRTDKFQMKKKMGLIQTTILPKNEDKIIVKTAYGGFVRYGIIGSEINRRIDVDEAIGPYPPKAGDGLKYGSFSTTGLPTSEWEFDTIYRYACFFKRNGSIKAEYNERKIREIEGIAVIDYNKFLEMLAHSSVARTEFMRTKMIENGYEWNPEYKVTRLFFWKGYPVIRVYYKGRFVRGGFWIGRKRVKV